MNPVIDPHTSTWVNGRQACKILQCAPSALQRAVMYGYIRAKLDAGPPRYHRADVEQFKVERAATSRRRAQPAGA
jgi:hypothetical protein